jgi:uncharacterized protein (TIGR02172 family)
MSRNFITGNCRREKKDMINISATSALERLEQYVRQAPDRDAVIFEPDESLTFKELWVLSGKIYAWLKEKGIGREDVVMYCLPRGVFLYACMVGTMRAGAAFVLAESENEAERTAFIRENSGCSLYVDEKNMQDILSCQSLEGYEPAQLHSLCYIAYTSGTTGHPKGVMHEYGSLDNAWKAVMVDGKPMMTDTDTFLSMSPMNFVAMPIIFAYSCGHGCTIAIMPYHYAESRESFSDYLVRAGVSCGYVTPSFLLKHLPFDYPWHFCILSAEPADGLYIPGMHCYNTYASTEAGCLLSVYELKKPMSPAPVGRSYSDVELLIVDENGTKAPPGETGEICFRTPYVRGYIDLQKDGNGYRREDDLFHTGDAGEINDDGDLVVRGRIDEMFKIGGYRIEPDEVANAVTMVAGLSHAVVRGFVYRNISSVVVFYTDDVQIDPADMREKLLGSLPEYMIPTTYIHMSDFPLLPSGKIDKLSLLPPEGSWDQFRNNTAAELPVIGMGRTACVFDIGGEIALKLFLPSIPYSTIHKELIQMHTARSLGIPVPDSYEIVRADDRYGILMDRMPGIGLETLIRENPDERPELIIYFVGAVRELHQISMEDSDATDIREESIYLCGQLDRDFCSEEEAAMIKSVFECIPHAETFVHGDCHPGNAKMDNGDIRFIDLMFSGKGHPVFDLIGMYSHYVFIPSFVSEEAYISKNNMTKKEAEELFGSFLETYLSGADAADLLTAGSLIRGVHAAVICLASVRMPGALTDEMLIEARRRAVRFAEGYCTNGRLRDPSHWSVLE